jgi:hypothetical protein
LPWKKNIGSYMCGHEIVNFGYIVYGFRKGRVTKSGKSDSLSEKIYFFPQICDVTDKYIFQNVFIVLGYNVGRTQIGLEEDHFHKEFHEFGIFPPQCLHRRLWWCATSGVDWCL